MSDPSIATSLDEARSIPEPELTLPDAEAASEAPADVVAEDASEAPADVVAEDAPDTHADVGAEAAPVAPENDIPSIFRDPPQQPDSPEVSPDGQRVAYLLPDATGLHQLWLSPLEGGEATPIDLPFTPIPDRDPDSGRRLRGPQWSPDGTTLALTGSHPDGNPLRTAVWMVPVPPPVVETPVAEASDAEDTEVMAAVAADDVPTDEGADVIPAGDESPIEASVDDAPAGDAGETTDATIDDVTPEAAPAVVAEAAEAPVEDAAVEESAEVVILTEPTPLSDHPTASDRTPRWSPDGKLVAFVRRIDGHDVIALASPEGALPVAAEMLTWSATHDREPSWSRDGLFLAFTRTRLEAQEHNDIIVFVLATGEIRNLTGEKASAMRHSLDWVPGRNLIAFVTRENEWLAIAVINSDNKAGWTVTREAGDKVEPRFAANEPRLVYLRTEGFTSSVCERGLHASGAAILDPGEGVGSFPRWAGEKRVLYGFSAAQRPLGFLLQDNVADAERTSVELPGVSLAAGSEFRQPTVFEFQVGADAEFSGLIYRTDGVAGKVPGIVYLPDGPLTTRRAEFQPEEQALARTAMAVLTPVLHGATGFGVAIENDLADLADTELEMSDIVESGFALGKIADVDETKLAVVGHGYGGALALLAAGGRPGVFSAVAVVDPITDWAIELEEAGAAWRSWITRQYGMPLTDRDHYAMRTPDTFAAVIDSPVILVTTGRSANRTMQADLFCAFLDEVGVSCERIDLAGVSTAEALVVAGKTLANRFFEGRDRADVVSDLRAEDA